MPTVTHRDREVQVEGELPAPGDAAPGFTLTSARLTEVHLEDFSGETLVLNIFPSLDTRTCAVSVRTFNQRAVEIPDAVVLCVSADLPFAHTRFCGAEGLDRVSTGSTFRNPEFLDDYGVRMMDGPMRSLCARAVVVIDPKGTVVHRELVPDIGTEPDYDAALDAVRSVDRLVPAALHSPSSTQRRAPGDHP